MGVDLSRYLWQLPGSRRFLDRVLNSIRAGKSLWVVFPPYMTLWAFEEALFDALRDVYYYQLNLQGCDQYSAGQMLTAAFPYLSFDEDCSIENLIRQPGGPTCIPISNFNELGRESRYQWAHTVSAWAEITRRYACDRSLCIYTTADAVADLEELLKEDVRLEVTRWYATLSTSEIGLLCRIVDDGVSLRTIWRQYLLPSLSGGDVALMEFLWEVVFDSDDRIIEALREYAARHTWEVRDAALTGNNWQPAPPLVEPKLRPQSLRHWNRGWLVYTPENGEEIHSALLPLLSKESEVKHRLWRAQAALLLPLIDSIRVLLCDYLIKNYGENWPRMARRTDVDPYAELGALEAIIRNTPELGREKRRWLSTVMQARLLRNKLAHYKPVTFDDFARFWHGGQKIYQQLRY